MPQRPTQDATILRPHGTTELVPLTALRTETVLSRFPIHNLAKKGSINIQITRKNAEGVGDLHWEVSYNTRYGQPRQLAYKLDTLVINQALDTLGRPLPTLIRLGSLVHIGSRLGLVDGGRQKQDLKRAFHQNAGAYIVGKLQYTGTDGTRRQLEAGFTRYSVIFTGERLPNGALADAVYLLLNEPYREVLNHAPVRPLDYDYLKALQPTAQRFYEIVSYRIFVALKYGHPQATLQYSDYCTFSAQPRYPDYERVKKQMYKVHRPHRQSGYLTKVWTTALIDSAEPPDWLLHYVPGPKAHAEYAAFNRPQALEEDGRAAPMPRADAAVPPPAHALVIAFYTRFHGTVPPRLRANELAQAAQLIAAYGLERALYVVDFSHQVAPETAYTPQTFGGILQYTDRALAAYASQQARAQDAAATAQCACCDANGWVFFDDAAGRGVGAKCSHDLAKLQAFAQRQGLTFQRAPTAGARARG